MMHITHHEMMGVNARNTMHYGMAQENQHRNEIDESCAVRRTRLGAIVLLKGNIDDH